MDTLPLKPRSSAENDIRDRRRRHERDRERKKSEHSHSIGPSQTRDQGKERMRKEGDGEKNMEREMRHLDRRDSRRVKSHRHSPGASMNNSSTSQRSTTKTYNMGDDFIPFVLSDPPSPLEYNDDDNRTSRHRRNEDTGGDRGRDREHTREWDRGKGKIRAEWGGDRGSNSVKRSYDMVHDLDEAYTNHRRRHAGAIPRRTPWIANVDFDSCNNVAEMLHREVEAFVKYISPAPAEDEIRGLIVLLITKAVTQKFPDAQVLPFGSYETKLYLPLGDIDLVIRSDSMAYSNKVTVLRALANTLKHAGITDNVTIIARAKVPIIKFVTIHGRFSVDISVNQGNGVVAGQIINSFLDETHGGGMALRSLVMVVKTFLSQRGLNEVFSGGLGSYSIVCLAVSFLQMHPKIRRGEIDAGRNLGVLVMEFFELYGCYFNYEEAGISLKDGGSYFSKKKRGWTDYYKKNLLSIEDPTDPSNDISKGSFALAKVRATFAGAHGILTAAAYLRAGIMSSRKEGRTFQLRDQQKPEDMSILSSVMGVTQETINHRLMVQELYDQRTLHRILGVSPKPATISPEIPRDNKQSKTSSTSQAQLKDAVSENARSKGISAESRTAQLQDEERVSNDEMHSNQESEEEGRYEIGSQRPKKRRKTGETQKDVHTVFTTDDDEDEDGRSVILLSGSNEEDEYESVGEDGASATAKRNRRSYWLSKGIGLEDDGDHSS